VTLFDDWIGTRHDFDGAEHAVRVAIVHILADGVPHAPRTGPCRDCLRRADTALSTMNGITDLDDAIVKEIGHTLQATCGHHFRIASEPRGETCAMCQRDAERIRSKLIEWTR
jgi:hypothetical protein